MCVCVCVSGSAVAGSICRVGTVEHFLRYFPCADIILSPGLQYLPPGILPLFYSPFTIALQAPTRFEDVSQMVEWLILIESKLQPEKMVVGDFSQLRGMLHMLQVNT